jgi:hypothetical protein
MKPTSMFGVFVAGVIVAGAVSAEHQRPGVLLDHIHIRDFVTWPPDPPGISFGSTSRSGRFTIDAWIAADDHS